MRFLKTILFILLVLAEITMNAQKVDLNFQKVTLTWALNELGKTHHLKIAFDNDITDKIIVSGRFKNVPLEEALTNLLLKTLLDFRMQGDVIIIYPSTDKKAVETNVAEEVIKAICMIKGLIKDKNSGETLPFATIYIPGSNIGAMANSDGFFNLITKSCDSTDITVSYLGYSPSIYKVKPEENPGMLTVLLNSEPEEIEEIEVKFEAAVFENARKEDPSCTQLNLNRINDIPSLSELDIVAPLQLLPGIEGTTETTAGLDIRKTPPDKNLVVYDGFSIYLMDHFFGSFSALNSKLIKDIKVYKVIADAKQGGRTSGIIEITGKSGNMYKPSFDIGADMLAIDGKAELPIVKDKLSFIIAGRRSYTDYYQTPTYISLFRNVRYDYEQYYKKIPFSFKSDENDPGYLFYDFGSKLTWKPSEKQVVSLSYYQAKDAMNFVIDSGYPNIAESIGYSSEGVGIRWGGALTRRWNAEVITGYSETKSIYELGNEAISEIERPRFTIIDTVSRNYSLKSNLKDFSGSFNNMFFLNTYNQLEFGYQLNSYESNYFTSTSFLFNNNKYADTVRNYMNSSVLVTPYAQHLLTGKRWTMKSGIRLGYYSLIKKTYPEIRFSVSYKMNEKFILKSIIGNYYQFTNKISLIENGEFRSSWVLSDSLTFPVVESGQLVTGFNYSLNKTLNLDVEIYHKVNKGMITVQSAYSRNGDELNQYLRIYNITSTINGIDILLRKSFGRYQAWIAYTLSKSTSLAENVNKGDPFPSYDDQLHELKIYNSLSLGGLNLTLSWIYGSGKPWDEYIFTDDYKLDPEYEKNSSRLPAYHRMDAGLNYTFNTKFFSLKTGVNVFNLYNHENIKSRFIALKENPVREVLLGNKPFKTVEVKGLGITPNVYVNLRF